MAVVEAVLLAGTASGTATGEVMVAVLTRLPVAAELMAAVTVQVTLLPTGMFTVAVTFVVLEPGPDHTAAPVAVQTQFQLVICEGFGSEKVAPVTGNGPAFTIWMV